MSPRERCDLLIRGGRVFTAAPPYWMDADIAVKDGAVAAIVDSKSSGFYADQVHEAQGCMVLPGLVDFHTHVYWGGTPLGINPEKLAPLTGVTTWVDMGSAGAGNFEGLYYHILKRSSLNIFCFLHLSYIGLVPVGDTKLRFGELFDSRLADVSEAARLCAAFPDAIKGLKLRLGMESSLTEGLAYLDMALALGERLGLPVVVHATSAPPTTAQVLSRLRAGDIYTHCFSSSPTSGILDRSGRLLPAALDAKARGVRFDLGYGARSFDSVVAAAAIAQGFLPDFVSSDLHAYSLGSTISGLPAVMAALCHAGLSLEEVILRATAYPAEYLGLSGGATPSRVGRLAVGSPADICILAWSEQDGDMVDGSGRVIRAPALEVRGVYRRGERLQAFDDGRQEGRWKPGLVGKKP